MDAKELLKTMGFDVTQDTYHLRVDGQDKLLNCFCLTHPLIPGLILMGQTLADAAKSAVHMIRILCLLNEKRSDLFRDGTLTRTKDE